MAATINKLCAPALVLAGLLVGCGDDQGRPAAGDAAPGAAADSQPTLAEQQGWDGAKVYDEVCDRCHKMGVDGAPELGDASAWGPRIAKGREQLFDHVLQGFNKMPARGECEFCTDAQLRAAMQYMIDNSGAQPPS